MFKTIFLEDLSGLKSGNYTDSYIYHLIKSGNVVYVGQTTRLKSRIYSHKCDKEFDRVRYYHCNLEDANNIESRDIVKHQPRYNGNLPKNKHFVIASSIVECVGEHLERALLDSPCAFEAKTLKRRRYFKKHVKYDLCKIINESFKEYFINLGEE